MRLFLFFITVFCTVLLFPAVSFASEELPVSDFLSQVLAFIQGFGGLSMVAKISTAVLLIIASMKVSFIRSFVWDKLGAYKSFIAPVLGLVFGVLALGDYSLPALGAYFFSGAGAIIMHEILDALKALPVIGEKYKSLIEFFARLFKKPA